MKGKPKDPPDILYLYRLFCRGCVLKVLSEHKDIGDLWTDILAREKDEDRIDFWEPRPDHTYEEIIVRPSMIIAVDRLLATELTSEQPNRDKRRKEDRERRENAVQISGGRIQIGQSAKRNSHADVH